MNEKIAVFDIDGTIFRSSMIIELVNVLVEKNIFPKNAKKEMESDYLAWVDRIGTYDKYISKVVEVFVKYIVGVNEKEVAKASNQLISEQKDRTYVYTRNLIKKLKNENYFLYAISGSPQVLVSEFAKVIGFDNFSGNDYEVINGKYSGKLIRDIFLQKSLTLKEFLQNHKEFSLKDSFGVGDSKGDISFLEIVENPIAFNPEKELAKHAKDNGWKIVVERKNVVYDLKDFNFEFTN